MLLPGAIRYLRLVKEAIQTFAFEIPRIDQLDG